VAEDYTRNVVIPPEPTVHRNAQPDSQPITPLDMPEDCVYGWLGNKARELHAPLGAAYMVVASAKEMVLRTIVIASALFLASTLLFGQNAEQHPEWPGKGQLFVRTCYQPVDRSHEQIRQDIALMKRAGFTLVRMGDLSWDAFEPSQGHFEFAWFDQILEQMNSANNQWFDTPQPGRLSDVFGIRTEEFYRPSAPPEFILNRKTEKASIGFYEVLEPKTAKAMALFTNTLEKSPAITANVYRKGRAIYLAVPAQMAALAPIVRSLYPALAVEKGPETPSGVYARVVEGRTLYVNTTSEEKAVNISGSKRGIISGTSYEGVIRLKPYDADLVE
jgi:beta-galactosidase GanA